MNASVRHLPLAMTWLAPELASIAFPDEPASDCANCPLEGHTFLRDIRCCTYEPVLPNFLAGRALRRNDAGSEAIKKRLKRAEGVTPLGIHPSAQWTRAYKANRDTDFGRNPDWRCPYWVSGELSCSIWRDRNAACRTWHCQHSDGVRGHHLWTATRQLLHGLEQRLAAWCVEQDSPPTSDRVRDWVAWYQRCATAVDRIEAQDLQSLQDDSLRALRTAVQDADAAREPTLPEYLGVEVREVREHGEEVELVGYTPWNTARFPRTVFVLIAALDGATPWREALAKAKESNPAVQEEWVRTLWDLDILRAPGDPTIPWGFEAPDLDPEALKAQYERNPP